MTETAIHHRCKYNGNLSDGFFHVVPNSFFIIKLDMKGFCGLPM
jgi:hypothetical protein